MILLLIWRNIWRNKRRSLITMASVAFTVLLAVTMKSMQDGVFGNLIRNMVEYYSGYIQLHAHGYWDEKILDNCFDPMDPGLEKIRSHSGIQNVIPRLETYVLISNNDLTKGCMLAGIDLSAEDSLTHFRSKISSGRFWKDDEKSLVLAAGLAAKMKLQPGDTAVLLGQGYRESFVADKIPVSGIIRFSAPELNSSLLLMPLSHAGSLLNTENKITAWVLDIQDGDDMDKIMSELRPFVPEQYELMNWKEMMPDIDTHIRADGLSFYVMMGILYIIILFGTFGTIFMITAERRYEFSMLLAIGMKKRLLSMILLGEIFLMTLGGALVGILVAVPIVLYFQEFPIHLGGEFGKAFEDYGFEPIWPAAFDWSVVFNQAIIVASISMIVGIYPLWHVYRFKDVGKIRM